MRELIFAMLAWAGANTGYDVSLGRAYPTVALTQPALAPVPAIVFPGLSLVVLREDWDACRAYDAALLFEEVFHIVQYRGSPVAWADRSKPDIEAEARALAARWTAEAWPVYRLGACRLAYLGA